MSTFEAIPIRVTLRFPGQTPVSFDFQHPASFTRLRQRLAAASHYGVRRVTARQYRAWKRMQGRRG